MASELTRRDTSRFAAGLLPRGLREAPWGGARLPATTIAAPDLPGDVLALLDHHLLDLGGAYGDPEAADPIQYDELRIEHDQGAVEIVVYNRAILLFTTDSEAVRRIHQVCCRVDDLAAG